MRSTTTIPLALALALTLTLALAGACATSKEQAPAPVPAEEPTARATEPPASQLPSTVAPLRYVLDLKIVPEERTFSGRVAIDVRLAEQTSLIWLHALDLEVQSARAVQGARTVAATLAQKTKEGVAAFTLSEPLAAGDATLEVVYTAPFDKQLKGLYSVVEDGHAYAFTQLESHFARLVFPGFDEPRFKVPFEITVTAKAEHEVIATEREVEKVALEGPEGLVRWRFPATDALPTYLLAFAVGPLDVVEAKGGALPPNKVRTKPLPFRGVAAKGKGPRLQYALEHTGPLLTYLEEYFGEPYPFKKLDIIAVPDFSSGAMENVGAVTFREWLLLLDDNTAPALQRLGFASVMAHELAHMWFGNLVTMPWWDDIWLNEAFATWMAFKATEAVFPGLGAQVAFAERINLAMGFDVLVSARQIRQPVVSDDDIRNAFDPITYAKGGSVLAMFEAWLTEDTFKDGIRRYMAKHRMGNATYEDLLASLSEAAGKDVSTPFKTFLFQPGIPFVQADVDCGGERPAVTLKQARYLPLGSKGEADKTWQVPVCFRYQDGKQEKTSCTLLSKAEGRHELDANKCPAWVLPNAGGAGYLRWSLPAAWLARLPLQKLSAAERFDYAGSLKAAFSSGRIDAPTAFALIRPLAADEERAVALAPLELVRFTKDHLVPEALTHKAKEWARELYRPVVRRLGYAPKSAKESSETRRLRAEVLAFLALSAGDEDTLTRLVALGDKALGDGGGIDPEVRPVALKAFVRQGGAAAFDKALARLEASDDALLREHLIDALSCTEDEALAARARSLALLPSLRGNERLRPLWIQAEQPRTRAATWGFLKSSWPQLLEVVPTTRQGTLPWLASFFCQASERGEVEAFLGARIEAVAGGPRNLQGTLEAIELCAARVGAHRETATAFFEAGAPVRR
jgi:cytosol alanyl aminopeptidase